MIESESMKNDACKMKKTLYLFLKEKRVRGLAYGTVFNYKDKRRAIAY